MEDFNLYEVFSVLRQKKWQLLSTFVVLLAISGIGVSLWSRYRSTATIQIQASEIPQGMTLPIGVTEANFVQALIEQRISLLEQKVVSTSSLVDIITKFNLYSKERQHKQITDIVEEMQAAVRVQLVDQSELSGPGGVAHLASSSQASPVAFKVSFTYDDPLLAQQVANELVNRFVDEDLKQRRSETKGTASFLGAQIETLEQSLVEQEKKIAAFRAQHPESSRDSLNFHQQMAATTLLNLQDVQRQLALTGRTIAELQGQLSTAEPYSRVLEDGQVLTTPAVQLKALRARYAMLKGQYGPDHPDIIKLSHEIAALEAESPDSGGDAGILSGQIADLRTNLAAAEKSKGPDHPDVLALRQQLTGLLDRQKELAQKAPHGPTTKEDADNPVYVLAVANLKSAQEQYNALKAQEAELRKQHDHYESLITSSPQVEQELAALTRDYENSQLRYRELKEKKLSADMSEQVDQNRIGQRLEVVDPPEVPTHTSPSRPILLLGGVVLSLAGGIARVLVAQMLSQVIRNPRDIVAATGHAPLVVVPRIFTREDLALKRRQTIGVAGGAVILFIGALLLFDQTVMPLDVLWSVIFNRFAI